MANTAYSQACRSYVNRAILAVQACAAGDVVRAYELGRRIGRDARISRQDTLQDIAERTIPGIPRYQAVWNGIVDGWFAAT
jgi:hypothetical protein